VKQSSHISGSGEQITFISNSKFPEAYTDLPENVRELAYEKYQLFRVNPFHPSLEFQAKGKGLDSSNKPCLPV